MRPQSSGDEHPIGMRTAERSILNVEDGGRPLPPFQTARASSRVLNRGLNPHIEHIARPPALDNFTAFAPYTAAWPQHGRAFLTLDRGSTFGGHTAACRDRP